MADVPFQRLSVLLLLLLFVVSPGCATQSGSRENLGGQAGAIDGGRDSDGRAEQAPGDQAAANTGSGHNKASGYKDPDPWIRMNRGIYSLNDRFDRWLLRPIASGYHRVLPDPMEDGVSNFFDNLQSPGIALNQILQGKMGLAVNDAGRFLVNTTLGIGGLFDVASRFGMPQHEEDFGQTLAVWGMSEGPFFVIPLGGPSTVTYAIGMIGDSFTNPVGFIENVRVSNSLFVLKMIDLRKRLLSAESLITGDEYLFIRDAYLQRRQFLVDDGEFDEDPFEDYEEFEDL